MPTYDNPRTGVVHWVVVPRRASSVIYPTLRCYAARWVTACHFLHSSNPSWNQQNFDAIGVPADVTCCHCRETAAFLDEVDRVRKAAETAEAD